MTISQLEYLLAVVNYGGFSAAAKHCSVTQPSLSVQIQNLEDELGIVLFDRSKKPITPTKSGRLLIEQARVALAEFYAMTEKAKGLKEGLSGKLSMAVVPTVSPYLIPNFIPEFIGKYPDVELDICDMFPADILDALDRDLIDIAIVSGGSLPEQYREKKLFVDKLYVYLSPDHELCSRNVIYEHDLDFGSLLFLSEGISQRSKRQEIKEAKRQVKQHYSFRNTSLETLMHLVDNTSGTAAVIPGMAVGYVPAERRGQVKVFGQPDSYRTITLATGRTCVKQGLIDAVSETIITMAERYILADFLRT